MTKGTRAAVVGVGALGTQVCKLLGERGVSHLHAIDPDRVELSNIDTTPVFSMSDIGRPKTDVVLAFLARHSPGMRCYSLPQEIASVGFRNLCELDIVFSCVDSDAARLEIGYVTRSLTVPMCDAGLPARAEGRARVSVFAGDACYSCLLAPSYRSRLLQRSYGSAMGCSRIDLQAENGSAPMFDLCREVAERQVREGLELLDRGGSPPHGSFSLSRSSKDENWQLICHSRSNSCPFHELQPPRHGVEGSDQTIADFLERTGAVSALLDWPICLKARCRICSAAVDSCSRIAVFWSQAKCPNCFSSELTPTVVLQEIGLDSPWRQVPFAALGISDGHMLMVKRG